MTVDANRVSDALMEFSTLREANEARQRDWCPEQLPDLSFRGNEIAGEVGEVCNVIKKLERERLGWRGSRDTIDHLAEELGDVVICASLIAIAAGIDLDSAVEAKFNATSEKVGLPHRLRRSPSLSGGEVWLSDIAMRIAVQMEAHAALSTTTAAKAESICEILSSFSPSPAPLEGVKGRKMDEVTSWLRDIQLRAGDALGQLTSNHPKYKVFEELHRVAASAQLASHKVTNLAAAAPSSAIVGSAK